MINREDIAALLFTTDNSKSVAPWSEWEHSKEEPRLTEYVYAMADALIAAGYRKPRTIHSIGAIAQREGMVLATAHGKVMVYINGHWQTPNSMAWWQPLVDWLPATVLAEGEAKL